jgi:hypothetical protein
MRELVKELAPLVVSAIRNTEVSQSGMEKACQSPRNNRDEKTEKNKEIQAERLAFLVSQMCLIYICNINNLFLINNWPDNCSDFTWALTRIRTSSFTNHRRRNSSRHLPMTRVKYPRLQICTSM